MDAWTPANLPAALLGAAARAEARPQFWLRRFVQLLHSGLVRAGIPPGQESAMSLAPAGTTCRPQDAAARCSARLETHRLRGESGMASFDLSGVSAAYAHDWVVRFEHELAGRQPGLAFGPVKLMFSVEAAHPTVDAFLRLRESSRLGYPALALRYSGGDAACLARLTQRSYEDLRLHLIPGRSVRPLSALHGLEAGECVLPAALLEARGDTAWLMLELDARLLTDTQRVRRNVSLALRFADNVIDHVDWPQRSMHIDAMLNRRVCLQVTGLGEVIRRLGLPPDSFVALRHLRRCLRFVRRCLVHESMLLARCRGPFAGLRAHELIAELAPRYGVVHASHLIRNRCLRHRHLLALSPFDVLPDSCPVGQAGRWLNLIPALSCADVITMRGSSRRVQLSVLEWARLLQLTAALPEQSVDITTHTL